VVQGYVVSRPAASTSSAAIGSRAGWLGTRLRGSLFGGLRREISARAQGAPSGKVATYPRQIANRLARRIATIAGVDAIEVKSECLCA